MQVFGFVLSILLLFTHGAYSYGQEFRLGARRYGIENGLPHRYVSKIIQDRNGFIWGGSLAGVFRFDGRNFKIYNKSENGLSGDAIDWVAEDASGNIWVCRVGKNAWIDIIDPVSGKVSHSAEYFKKSPMPVPLAGSFIPPPSRLPDGTLVLGGLEEKGWVTYHPDRGWHRVVLPNCSKFFLYHVTPGPVIWGAFLGKGSNDNCFVGLSADGRTLHQYKTEPGGFILSANGLPDDSNLFYLLEYNSGKFKTWEFKADGQRVQRQIPDPSRGTVCYFSHHAGAIQFQFPRFYNKKGNLLLDLEQLYPELDNAQFNNYFQDHEGNVWLSTSFGLIVVEFYKDHFQRLLYDPAAKGGRGIACRGLLEKNGNLFVNSENKINSRFVIDLKSGKKRMLGGQYSLGICESFDGNIWTDMELKDWETVGISKISASDGAIVAGPYQWQKQWARVWQFFEESPERLLLLHLNDISIFNPQTQKHSVWPDNPEFPEFKGAAMCFICRDRKGRIWVCTDQGLYEIKPGGGIAGRYWNGGKGKYYLPYSYFLYCYQDADGMYWLGTNGGGLIRWDGTNAIQIQRKNGLLNNVVYAVFEDNNNNIWLPTDYGIVTFDKKTLKARRTWLSSDGVTNNEFNRLSYCKGEDGTLYFGGLNGITAFNPDHFFKGPGFGIEGRKLLLSELLVLDGRSGQLESRMSDFARNSNIVVNPDDRYLQFEFSLLDFVNQEKASYSWSLDGVTKDWEMLKEPVLRLPGLPSGTHTLHIRAQARDGSMAANELTVVLKVLPPLYLRWWFLLLASVLAGVALWIWIYWRELNLRRIQGRLEAEVQRQTSTMRKQTEELKHLDETKSRFFANVSHELRTPLTLILGPLGTLLKDKTLPQASLAHVANAQQHAKHLLQLVNEILDLGKLESGNMTIHEQPFDLQNFLRRVIGAFESHAELLQVHLIFEYRAAPGLRILADEDKLQKVLQNLLSNALKFTPPFDAGVVRVTADQIENNIQIGVHDNGRGIDPEDLPFVFDRFFQTKQPNAPIEGGSGIGLALCREFANLMKGSIRVESEKGVGSHFFFQFPLKEVMGFGLFNTDVEEEPSLNTLLQTEHAPNPTALLQVKPARILLVEDNPVMRQYLQTVLAQKYEVSCAENGQVALDMLAEINPQMLISDIMMPVMDGFQLLEKLKSDSGWRHLPVIMLTARAGMRDKLQALRTGVDDYLLKPFEEEELLIRVDNLISNSIERSKANKIYGDLPAAAETPAQMSAEDMEWLSRLELKVREMIGDSRLSADWLASEMYVGRTAFFRRVKTLTGLTPNEYVQVLRMACARELFEARAYKTVKEAAFAVGLRDVKYFSEQFQKHFGRLPSSYL